MAYLVSILVSLRRELELWQTALPLTESETQMLDCRPESGRVVSVVGPVVILLTTSDLTPALPLLMCRV